MQKLGTVSPWNKEIDKDISTTKIAVFFCFTVPPCKYMNGIFNMSFCPCLENVGTEGAGLVVPISPDASVIIL